MSSSKKSVTIQAPFDESVPSSPKSMSPPSSDKRKDAPLVTVLESPYKPGEMITVNSAELSAELSLEEEKKPDEKVKKGNKRLSTFWKKRNNQVAAAA